MCCSLLFRGTIHERPVSLPRSSTQLCAPAKTSVLRARSNKVELTEWALSSYAASQKYPSWELQSTVGCQPIQRSTHSFGKICAIGNDMTEEHHCQEQCDLWHRSANHEVICKKKQIKFFQFILFLSTSKIFQKHQKLFVQSL